MQIATGEISDISGELAAVVGALIVEYVLLMVTGIMAESTIAVAVAEVYAGRRSPSLQMCIKRALALFCNIFCAGFVAGIGIGAFLMMGFLLE